jgi:nucleoside-diphosphate-sugar epimerase
VPYVIRCCLEKQRPILRNSGKFVRDYIYVKDVSRCYRRAAEMLTNKDVAGEAFGFSLEQPFTALEIVAAIQKLMKCTTSHRTSRTMPKAKSPRNT